MSEETHSDVAMAIALLASPIGLGLLVGWLLLPTEICTGPTAFGEACVDTFNERAAAGAGGVAFVAGLIWAEVDSRADVPKAALAIAAVAAVVCALYVIGSS